MADADEEVAAQAAADQEEHNALTEVT